MNRCINGCYAPRRRPRLVCVACSLGMPPERNPDTSAIAAGICALVRWLGELGQEMKS